MDNLTLDLIETLYVIMKTTTDADTQLIAATALTKIPIEEDKEESND